MPNAILTFITPAFVILLLLEVYYDWRKDSGYYRINDTIGSLATGVLSQSTQLVIFGLGIWALAGLNGLGLPLWSMDSYLAWAVGFIAYDFIYYWKHRYSHEVNFLWAGHVVHHQSEEYNLSTALRQPSTHILTWVFSIPLLLLGMPWQMVIACGAWNLVYQFWVHTRHLDKMPSWFEAIMVTPSHHRVHHAQNPEYIDKNHGGVFIIWDKWFNTYQQELAEQPPIYGVRRPLHSFNPFTANFQVWWQMSKDAWHAERWADKLRIWFMPTGWRPADVEQRYPINKYPLESFTKYDPQLPLWQQWYCVLQFVVAVLAAQILTANALELSAAELGFTWVLVSLPLLSVGSALNNGQLHWELLRLLLSWTCLLWLGGVLSSLLWWVALASMCTASSLLLWGQWPRPHRAEV
ncbi:MAG: sterol desaturase family protein [Cellvibrionaceae bacterium]|nr:sterol desaturase family protein [Cellvibrionaceae bacterium]MCV6624730.1 sterol desaturase family protein [Cellvibrionaceae bacterium]